jgi:hypothetical protein
MKIISYKSNIRALIIIGIGFASLALPISFIANIVRARILDIDKLEEQFEAQREAQLYNPQFIPRVVIQGGQSHEKGLDLRCILWETNHVNHGWLKSGEDTDFFIDYYVPPEKNPIICTTPALALVLKAGVRKPFVYEVYPTDYGLRVRIIIGVSEVRELCRNLTGDINCASPILLQQGIVRYEP